MYLLIQLFCLSWINYAELISIRAWWPFSRALNQSRWNFMYIQQQFIDTFKNIWRHPFQWLKILGGRSTPTLEFLGGSSYFLGGGMTRSGGMSLVVTITVPSILCVCVWGGAQFTAEIIKMFRAHMIHLPPSSSVLWRAFYLPCKHSDLSPSLTLWGRIRAGNGNFERFWLLLNTENH